jgi:hypothetical protein
MWGDEPREGTEAYKVKELAEKKKKEARDNRYDEFFSTVYHDCSIEHFPSWIKNENRNYIHPGIISSTERNEKIGGRDYHIVEFLMGDRAYEVRNSSFWGPDEQYFTRDLYLNGKKIFSISETEHSDEYTSTFNPFNVNAYVNNVWVKDFFEIQQHYEKASREAQVKWAEDPKKTKETRENFGITDKDLERVEASLVIPVSKSHTSQDSVAGINSKPFWKRFWFWVFVFFILVMVFSE